MFSQAITEFWRKPFLNGDIVVRDGAFSVAVNPDLSEERRTMLLETSDGRVLAAVTPTVADHVGLDRHTKVTEQLLRRRFADAGITLHGADYVFYYPQAGKATLRCEGAADGVRPLTQNDTAAFAEFEAAASEQDLEDAYVELDHWAVFGSIEQDRLASVASMYPWQSSRLADLGVLTLAPFRGKGHARRVVRAISRHALDQDHEPQYRCQIDNEASVALASASGLTLFGTWQVVSPDSAR